MLPPFYLPRSEHISQLTSRARYPQNKIIRRLLLLLLLHRPLPAKRAPAPTPRTQLRLLYPRRCRVQGPWLMKRQILLSPSPLFAPVSRVGPCTCVLKGYGVN